MHNSKGYWQQSTLSFQPEIIFQLDSMLDFKTVLKIGTKEALGKVKIREKGVRQKCKWRAWVRTAFDELALSRLGAFVHPDNVASIRDLEKVRFRAERHEMVMRMD